MVSFVIYHDFTDYPWFEPMNPLYYILFNRGFGEEVNTSVLKTSIRLSTMNTDLQIFGVLLRGNLK